MRSLALVFIVPLVASLTGCGSPEPVPAFTDPATGPMRPVTEGELAAPGGDRAVILQVGRVSTDSQSARFVVQSKEPSRVMASAIAICEDDAGPSARVALAAIPQADPDRPQDFLLRCQRG